MIGLNEVTFNLVHEPMMGVCREMWKMVVGEEET